MEISLLVWVRPGSVLRVIMHDFARSCMRARLSSAVFPCAAIERGERKRLMYTNVSLDGRGGTFLKVINDGSKYVEVVTLGTAVHQNFGRCTGLK